jgi:hypothetical protein
VSNRKNRKRKDKKKALKRPFARSLPPDTEKMSEVLLDFIRPYENTWQTEEQLQKLLVVAIVAWNAAVAGGSQGEELIRSTMATLPPDAQEDFLTIIVALVERKQRFFADNTRLIINYQLTMNPDGPHLLVASTLSV